MHELYKLADKIRAELKRIELTGTDKKTVESYRKEITKYIKG